MRHARVAFILAVAAAIMLAVPLSAGAAAWPDGSPKVKLARERVHGADRYSTAVAIAKKAYPAWAGVDHVVIASGEDRAAADPLTAASLCWAYDAPMLLTQSTKVPGTVAQALREIKAANPNVKVIVVGGPVSVPWSVQRDLAGLVGAGHVERPWAKGDRFALAAGIAHRTRAVAADTTRTIPSAALIANGQDSATFFDALSASAVSANTGIPVLLTRKNGVPAATTNTLATLKPAEVVLVGGPASITWDVYKQVGGDDRFHGADRHRTSVAIARGAAARGWVDPKVTCLAAALPDAVTGAALAGVSSGPLLVVPSDTLSAGSAGFLADDGLAVTTALVLGGPRSVSNSVLAELGGAPGLTKITSVAKMVAKKARLVAKVGVNTSEVKLYASGKLVTTKAVKPFSTVDFGQVWLPTGATQLKIVATNPDGLTATATRTVKRLTYPASTSIVIDKSDFKLYWVKNDVLIKAYPIAHGKPGWSTPETSWKIGAKYISSGVYGPRKMRLFRKTGSGYTRTAYLIHGTNQEWVIGTRASHGCIRMYNKDVLEFYPQVPIGTKVVTRR